MVYAMVCGLGISLVLLTEHKRSDVCDPAKGMTAGAGAGGHSRAPAPTPFKVAPKLSNA